MAELSFRRARCLIFELVLLTVPFVCLASSGVILVCKTPDTTGVDYRTTIALPAGLTFRDVGRDLDLTPDIGEPQNVVLLTLKTATLGPGEQVCVKLPAKTDADSSPTNLSPRNLRRYELVGVTTPDGDFGPFMRVDSPLPNLFARVATEFK